MPNDNQVNEACKTCGESSCIDYSLQNTDTIEQYVKLFGQRPFQNPFYLCTQCTIAHDFLLNHIIILTVEKQTGSEEIKKAEEIWGGRAINMLAAIRLANDNLDWARRVLSKEAFADIEKMLDQTK